MQDTSTDKLLKVTDDDYEIRKDTSQKGITLYYALKDGMSVSPFGLSQYVYKFKSLEELEARIEDVRNRQ